jgi:hypothetical protein
MADTVSLTIDDRQVTVPAGTLGKTTVAVWATAVGR